MPITFPAHAAAILPLRSRWLPGTALLVGSTAPDFAFWMGGRAGIASHRLDSIAWFSLPLGLLLYAGIERFVLPALRMTSPRLGRLSVSRGFPRSGREWLQASAAIVVGALTHLIWDSFAHDGRWPARVLYPGGAVHFLSEVVTYPTLVHRISSIGGSLIVVAFVGALYRRTPASPAPHRDLFPVLVLSTACAAGVGLLIRASVPFAGSLAPGWTVFVFGFGGLIGASAWILRRATSHPPIA